jgi:uncharacterized protein
MTSLSPIAPDLWTASDRPQLNGGRRIADGEIVFPMPDGDAAAAYEPVALSRTGTLWSWTIQSFRPKSPPYEGPEAFVPYALGYVELPGEVIVETRLTQSTSLKIGMPMELVIVPLNDAQSTFAFSPVEGAQ